MTKVGDTRDEYIDSASGILILYMIYYHIAPHCGLDDIRICRFTDVLYFFMPWFFFKSGMFAKQQPFIESLRKDFYRLLVPYIVFSSIGYLQRSVLLYLQHKEQINPLWEIVNNGAVGANLPLWFLLSLFVVKVLHLLATRLYAKIVFIILPLLVFVLLSGLVDCLPVIVRPMISGLFFFCIGSELRTVQYRKDVFVSSFVAYAVLYICCYSFVDIRVNSLEEGYYIVWLLGALCGCICINNLSKLLALGRLRYLRIIGRNSMVFFVTHWLFLRALLFVLSSIESDSLIYSFLLFGLMSALLLLTYFLSKIDSIRWVFGFN